MQFKVRKCPKIQHQTNNCNSDSNHVCSIVHIELATSWPVTILWIVLSWVVSALSTAAFVHPEWFVKEQQPRQDILEYDKRSLVSTLGLVSVCYNGLENASNAKASAHMDCHSFDEDFPTSSWQVAYVLFGSGCVLLTWCSILAFCGVWIVGRKNRQMVSLLVGRIQMVAVFLQAISLLLYPVILSSSFARTHCGSEAAAYSPAGCRIGWAYIAAITSTVLSCYCPLLAHFSHYNMFSPCLWTEI